jgi:hypothetical protein
LGMFVFVQGFVRAVCSLDMCVIAVFKDVVWRKLDLHVVLLVVVHVAAVGAMATSDNTAAASLW